MKTLGFTVGGDAGIDCSSLVLMGHELGGLTALSVAAGDSRVKAVATIDPWLGPYNKMVTNGKFRISDADQALCIVESDGFANEIDAKVGEDSDQHRDITNFLAKSANSRTIKQEHIKLRN